MVWKEERGGGWKRGRGGGGRMIGGVFKHFNKFSKFPKTMSEQKAIEDYIKSEGWMRAEDNEMDGWMDEYMDESNSASQEFESTQNTIVCPMCLK